MVTPRAHIKKCQQLPLWWSPCVVITAHLHAHPRMDRVLQQAQLTSAWPWEDPTQGLLRILKVKPSLKANSSGTRLQFVRKPWKQTSWWFPRTLVRNAAPRDRWAEAEGCLKPTRVPSFIHLFIKLWLRACSVPGTVLGSGKDTQLHLPPSVTLI